MDGGFIEVAPKLQAGTIFAIHLPTDRQVVELKAAPGSETHARFRGSGQVVLLVDDEELVMD